MTITILKMIECWNSYVWPRLVTDDPLYYLVSNGIQEIRENGLGRENIPAMHGGGGSDQRAAHRTVSGVPQKDHGAMSGRNQRMRHCWENGGRAAGFAAFLGRLAMALGAAAGFSVPEQFDGQKQGTSLRFFRQKIHQQVLRPIFISNYRGLKCIRTLP